MSPEYHWLDEVSYKKAIGQTRLQVGAVLAHHFSMYGLQENIPSAIDEILEVVEAFGQRVRGKDKPIRRKRG